MKNEPVVLAFSGGLDTSFCVPWLRDQGYEVTTLFVDTGGVDADERDYIAKRATELGAAKHVAIDASREIWDEVVVPLIRAGSWYQNQYPLLCSDRYVIVRKALELCDELGTKNFAHGCTGMGNDQVRFDLAVRALGDYDVIAPIRQIQQEGVYQCGLVVPTESSGGSRVPGIQVRMEEESVRVGLQMTQLGHPFRRLPVLHLRIVEARGHQQVGVVAGPDVVVR